MGRDIESFEERLHEVGKITVLPDYFVDRLVRFNSIEQLADSVKNKGRESGGGSIRGISQEEVKGGNAVNVAFALGKLGASARVIAIANGLAAETLRSTFRELKRIDVRIIEGKCGYTVALEYEEGGRHVNVMLSDTGDLRDFDGSRITQWDAITDSKIVVVLNWAANSSGNKLCERVFGYAHEHREKTFFDPADLSEVTDRLPEFQSKILDNHLADIISLNDNETRFFCKSLCSYTLPQDYSEADLRSAAKKISDLSGETVDIHTRNFSVSCENGKNCTTVPCHKVEQKIVTGAGDVWDSADLVGHLIESEPADRLSFANAAAGLYVSRVPASPPTFAETLDFRSKFTAARL